MTRKEHEKECLEKMGNKWSCVHKWLDETARDYFPFMSHRQIRHHKEGVELVRGLWGNSAAAAAELHIISDEGYIPTKEQIEAKYGPLPSPEKVAKERKCLGIK